MDRAITEDLEVLAETGVLHIAARITAHVEAQILEEAMVVVKVKVVLAPLDTAAVNCGLTVLLADVLLRIRQFERADRARAVLDVADKRLDLGIVDSGRRGTRPEGSGSR